VVEPRALGPPARRLLSKVLPADPGRHLDMAAEYTPRVLGDTTRSPLPPTGLRGWRAVVAVAAHRPPGDMRAYPRAKRRAPSGASASAVSLPSPQKSSMSDETRPTWLPRSGQRHEQVPPFDAAGRRDRWRLSNRQAT